MNKQSNKVQIILTLISLFFLITIACVSYPESKAPASPAEPTQVQQDPVLNAPVLSETQEEVHESAVAGVDDGGEAAIRLEKQLMPISPTPDTDEDTDERPELAQKGGGMLPYEAYGQGGILTFPNDAPYDAVFFESYGVNPFIDTEDDNLSTFAIDVDTGSYSIARRYVTDGHLPPKEAIRVEEFVNYFDQNYPYPSQEQAFHINLDGAFFPFSETEQYQMLRVGIQGYTVPIEARKNAALTFVIDVSGSMDRENRLELVKQALQLLVNQLRPTDTVSIVVYGSTARIVLEPTSGDQKETILQAIFSLQPEGSTNAEAGLDVGYDMALKAFNPEGINRVILCSDGVANVGKTGAESIWDEIKIRASEGIQLTTVGFGMGNFNDVLMEQLADNGDGFYAYVDTLREAKRLFVEDLSSTLQVIALDAKIQVDFNPETVARYRLVGFENRDIADEDFRNDTVDAGEVGAGHTITALYEVKLHPQATGRAATVYLRWENPDTHAISELEKSINTEEIAQDFNAANPSFQWDVLVAEYAEILRESYWAKDSSLETLLEEVQRVSPMLEGDPQVQEFVELLNLAIRASQ